MKWYEIYDWNGRSKSTRLARARKIGRASAGIALSGANRAAAKK